MADQDNFQRRATEEGRQVQDIAKKVLRASGFTNLRPNEVLSDLGVTINFVADDRAGAEWYFDVSGAFTSNRAGLIRTDTMWKSLGRANVLNQAGSSRLVLLTTNLPKAGSAGHKALAVAAETFFDAVEMLSPIGKARLKRYAEGDLARPLPGLRTAEVLYAGYQSTSTALATSVRVPIAELAHSLPERATASLMVMPHRLKVFLPSRSAAGGLLPRRARDAAGVKIRNLLEQHAGGCTLQAGLGSWLDPLGGEMFENVVLVEAYATDPFPEDLVGTIVAVLTVDLEQHTAALIVNDSMVHVTPR